MNVTDNVLVSQVLVKILGQQGEILEQGQAVPGDGCCCEYEAKDLAGNVTCHETE